MKKRFGFVSNSSSSSFCVIGVWLDKYQFAEKYKSIVENRNTLDVYVAGCENQENTVGVGYVNMDEDIHSIFLWDRCVFVGMDVMDEGIASVVQKSEEIAKKLSMKEEDIIIRGWGYYNG